MITKTEFVKRVAKKNGTSVAVAKQIVDSVLEVMEESVASGEGFNFVGYLKVEIKDVPETSGIIQLGDRKGQTWVKPAHKVPKIKLGSILKSALEEK